MNQFCRWMWSLPLGTLGAAVCGAVSLFAEGTAGALPPRHRHPTALALVAQERVLVSANARSGSVSVIDLTSRAVVDEVTIGKQLADVKTLPDQRHLLAVDEAGDGLIALEYRPEGVRVVERLPVRRSPVSIAVIEDGSRCVVASLWSRTLTVVDLSLPAPAGKPPLRRVREIALPFSPREQLWLPDGSRLLVADAFGGRLALVDVERGRVESVRELPGHNIRGLAWDAENRNVLIAHHTLNRFGRTVEEDIHWGMLMASELQLLPLESVLDPDRDLLGESRGLRLGNTGRGASDPEALALIGPRRLMIAFGGTGEAVIAGTAGYFDSRLRVGRRPTAIIGSADGDQAYMADELSDSIAVIDMRESRIAAKISLGPMPELTPADRGERLFYDARHSHNEWLSCHSCHTDGHSNGLLADTRGDGSFGTPKRVLPLGGVAETGPWAWNGRFETLEAQIASSIESTMHGPALTGEQTNDLAAFLKTIPVPPSAEPNTPRERIMAGRALFEDLRCGRCHAAPTYTSRSVHDVGLKDEEGERRFNPPSLRGVGHRSPLFHDGRAESLEEVFATFKHQLPRSLSESERSALVAFLKSL